MAVVVCRQIIVGFNTYHHQIIFYLYVVCLFVKYKYKCKYIKCKWAHTHTHTSISIYYSVFDYCLLIIFMFFNLFNNWYRKNDIDWLIDLIDQSSHWLIQNYQQTESICLVVYKIYIFFTIILFSLWSSSSPIVHSFIFLLLNLCVVLS